MTYRELTDFIRDRIGDVDFKILGVLNRTYKREFIRDCVLMIPNSKKELMPKQKAAYLSGICKNTHSLSDLVQRNRIDMEGFNL